MKLKGVVPAIGTPLADGDTVDEAGLRRLTRYLLHSRVHGILANGSMGGFAFLTDEEQIRAISIIVSEVKGTVPVVATLGETGTIRAVRKAKQIAREGVNALCVLPPYYFLTSQEHLISYFSEIAAAVDLPVMLYDNPTLTKVLIKPATVAELRRRIPNLVGIKVSNQDCNNLQEVLHLVGGDPSFSVLTGSESLFLVSLRMGADGGIGGLYTICPHQAVALYEAFSSGENRRAQEMQRELINVWQIFRYGNIWGGFDEALRYLEICHRATGGPYVTTLTEEDAASVRTILDQYVRPYLSPRV